MGIDKKIPVKLKKEPLLEAVWEIRFASTKRSVSDLLPGLIYNALSDKYPNIVRLPAADIPAPITEQDPNLRYVPKIRLEGDNRSVQIGEHVLSLSNRRPYLGWKLFSADIRKLISVVRETTLIDKLERFSMKYIDIIELNYPPDLSCLNIELKLGGHEINTRPVQLRTEIKDDNLVHIVQIVSPAEAVLPKNSRKFTGVLLDIDTIIPIQDNKSWDEIENSLDMVHSASKRMFFGLLTPETIEKLEPAYEE